MCILENVGPAVLLMGPIQDAPQPPSLPVSLKRWVAVWANDGDAVFIREFTLIRRDHLPEEPLHDSSQKPEDPRATDELFSLKESVFPGSLSTSSFDGIELSKTAKA
ncbi:ADAMTS-like protein 1 isoform X1 [Lates japonicus]|uniref:ADAMTS-like protein 1 isoform X1 n=1 Tax=Lates japonicus TaxID=270547 RepID=A0AAD3MH25_LATJO|nr:ADAMTS-like protein 1 isoform X1 [Lates japonicus]